MCNLHLSVSHIRNNNLGTQRLKDWTLCSPVVKRETEVAMLIYAGSFDPCTHTNGMANTAAGKETDRKTDGEDVASV